MRVYNNHTEEQLLSELREGESIAFREIYSRYASKLFKYACSRIRNREDCKELVQEVFEALWTTQTVIQRLRPFLFTMMKYKIINYYEKQSVRNKFSEYLARFEENFEEQTESGISELRATLNASLAKLPNRCQEAVRMRIDEELTLDEIAIKMGVDKASVQRYLTRAMAYFKKEHRPLHKSL